MAQTTSAVVFGSAGKVEFSTDGTTFFDISGVSNAVESAAGELEVVETEVTSGARILTPYKLAPRGLTIRQIYTEIAGEYWSTLESAYTARTPLIVRWLPKGAATGNKKYVTATGYISEWGYPRGEAESGEPIITEWKLHTPSIALGTYTAPWYQIAGITNPIVAYQPKGAASQAASYINLVNPGTYDAGAGVVPTWDATDGWTFNGTTQYLTTSVTPLNTYTTLIKFTNCTDNGYAFGVFEATPGYGMSPRKTLNTSARYYSGSASDVAPHATSGVMGIAHNKGVRDGATEGSLTGTGTYLRGMYVGAVNDRGALYEPFAASVQAFGIWDYTLSAGELVTVCAAMAAV